MKVYTYSELSQFQQCEREYEYRYENLLEPVFDGLARPVGTAIHIGLEQLYAGEGLAQVIDAAKTRYFQDLGEYLELQGKPNPTDESPEADAVRKVKGGWVTVKHLLENYPWRDVPDVLHTEAEIVVPMGSGRAYKGRIDRIMQVNGGVWNHDTKSSGMLPAPIVKTMRLRQQFAGYTHLSNKWLKGDALEGPPIPPALAGKQINGTVLDLLFKPRVTFHRKAKQYTGEMSCKNESYHREPLHIGADACADFEHWFHDLADRIEAQPHSLGRIQNTQHCFQYNKVCAFFEMCRLIGADMQKFKTREHKHDYGYGNEARRKDNDNE